MVRRKRKNLSYLLAFSSLALLFSNNFAHAENPFIADFKWFYTEREELFVSFTAKQSAFISATAIFNQDIPVGAGAEFIFGPPRRYRFYNATSSTFIGRRLEGLSGSVFVPIPIEAGKQYVLPVERLIKPDGQEFFHDGRFIPPTPIRRQEVIAFFGQDLKPTDFVTLLFTDLLFNPLFSDNTHYHFEPWNGVRLFGPNTFTLTDHTFTVRGRYGNDPGRFDTLRLVAFERLLQITTRFDFPATSTSYTNFDFPIILDNGDYEITGLLRNAATGAITVLSSPIRLIINAPDQPPKAFNPFFSNFQWFYNERDELIIKFRAEQSGDFRFFAVVNATIPPDVGDPALFAFQRYFGEINFGIAPGFMSGLRVLCIGTGQFDCFRDHFTLVAGEVREVPAEHLFHPIKGHFFHRGRDSRPVPITRQDVVSFLGRDFSPSDFLAFVVMPPHPSFTSLWVDNTKYHFRPAIREPVIIVPGIMGSWEKGGEWLIDPILHIYDNLIATLAANGYERGKTLFDFPYQWRQSNVITARELRDKINSVQTICQCPKVDLVVHSMGGLMARQYIQSSEYENDVDQLIFLGTPHLGAPKAYLAWEGAEFGFEREDKLLKFLFSREAKNNGFPDLFSYIRNRPIVSVQELLPIYDYIREKVSGELRVYPTNYPQNVFLENLASTANKLFASGMSVSNIVGDIGNTINLIRVVESLLLPLWEHGYPDGFNGTSPDRGLELGLGDGTVPARSGEFVASDHLVKITSGHSDLPTDAEGLIFEKLTGHDPDILIRKFRVPNILLVIRLLSPVDMLVVAPDGKKIGKDFSSGQEINEIEGAFYSGFDTDDEFVVVPDPIDGQYKLQVAGTATGSYTVASGYISDAAMVEREFVANTRIGLESGVNLGVDNTNPENLDLRPEDQTPPSIAITSPEAKAYLRSDKLTINFQVSDAESGVFSQESFLDERMVSAGEQIDLFFEKLGNHTVRVRASDFVGNIAQSEVQFEIVSTLESTMSDVERAYALGWIDNAGIKTSLMKKLEAAKKTGTMVLKAFENELGAQRGKHVNEKAYLLLREDAEFLRNN